MIKSAAKRWLNMFRRTKTSTYQRRPQRRMFLEELEKRETPATYIWSGAGVDNLWMTAGNWLGGARPTGAGDDLVFPPGAGQLTNNNNFDPAAAAFNSITISGDGFNLQGNALTLGSISGGSGFINVNGIALNDTVNFAGITMGGAAGAKQFFTVNSNQSVLTINSPITGVTGVELSKDGNGKLVLTANNINFNGPVSVTEGALNIRHRFALGDTASATTVLYDSNTGKFGQLQVENVVGTIAERLTLNGFGPLNDGALLNVSGNNTWTGQVTLDSNTTFGAANPPITPFLDTLVIQGVITDQGAGHSVIKEGPGRITFDPINAPGTPGPLTGNSYRGQTIINDGILNIRHSMALGNDTVPNDNPANGLLNDTVVYSFFNRSGTLQLERAFNPNRIDPNATATGFTVSFELLTLNGPGVDGVHVLPKQHLFGPAQPGYNAGDTVLGALHNLTGNNTWAQDISLWSDDTSMLYDPIMWEWPTVGIGAEPGVNNQLTITGHIDDLNINGNLVNSTTVYSLIKTRPGRVVIVNGVAAPVVPGQAYRGRTEILQGFLNIRDSQALGTNGNVQNETIVFPEGTLELEADNINDSVQPVPNAPDGTPHLPTDIIIGDERLSLMGTGAGGNGALRNIRGTNEERGPLPILTALRRGETLVQPVQTPTIRNPFVPTWWTVTFYDTGASVGVEPDRAPFAQFDLSQLTVSDVVSGGSLTKVGAGELVLTDVANTMTQTLIVQGWITARNNRSLGGGQFPDTLATPAFVNEGASLHLKQTRIGGNPINLVARLFISGQGISHRYPEINNRGALLNLSNNNVVSSIVNLVGTTNFPMIGIGADIANSPFVPADQTVTQSTLTLTNLMQEAPPSANLAITGGSNTQTPSGVNKLGRKRVNLQGMGTFSGDNQISEGVLRLQSDTALGLLAGSTLLVTGAALELRGYDTTDNTFNGGLPGGIQIFENLTLSGLGNDTADDPTHNFTTPTRVDTLTSVDNDNMWRAPIVLSSAVAIDARTDARLSLWKPISGGGGITKNGLGKLILGGVNTYNGVTNITRGTVNLQSSSALGSPAGGTVVANDAQIELQGDITIAGESLTIQGNGPNAAPNIPLRWFGEGPGPIIGGQTIGNENVTGRVTGMAVDPRDPNVIYLSAADGGAWRTKNGGATWQPLIDNIDGTPIGFDTNRVMFTGSIAVAPNSRTIYVALGEANNGADTYYGRGILRSLDYGRTWTRMQPPVNLFDRRTVSRIYVDPIDTPAQDFLNFYVGVADLGVNGLRTPANNGVWQYLGATDTWRNLILNVSAARAANSPPAGPGPDDDLNVLFSAADQISDVLIFDDTNPFAAPGNRFVVAAIGAPQGAARINTNLTGNTTVSGINSAYVSLNDGASWNRNSFAVSDGANAHNGVIKLAGTHIPNSPFTWTDDVYTIYAAVTWPTANPAQPLPASQFREIWKTTIAWNGGWVVAGWALTSAQPFNYMGTQGLFNTTIAVHPADANYVFVGGAGMPGVGVPDSLGPFVSVDGGAGWSFIANTANPLREPHVGYHTSAWEGNLPSSQGQAAPVATVRMVTGTDGGAWRLDSRLPGAISWTNLNSNNAFPNSTSFLSTSQFIGVDVHPTNPFFAVGGAQDNGTAWYNDNPGWRAVDTGDGGVVQINNKNPQVVFHGQNGALRRSTTGPLGPWSTILSPGGAVPFVLDRVNPSRLLVGAFNQLRESGNSDTTALFNSIGAAQAGTITGIAVSDRQGPFKDDLDFPVVDRGADSYDSDTIYLTVLTNNPLPGDFDVRVSKNHGTAFFTRNAGLTRNNLSDIAVDPRSRDTAYVTRSVFGGGHVFRTTNSGQASPPALAAQWIDISFNLPDVPAWSVAVNPRSGDVYVGTDIGVYVLPNGTITWNRLSDSLPAVQVKELVYNSYTNMLSAGTYGRGLYQVWLDDSAADSGAVRVVTGSSVWTGNVTITGAGASLDLRAEIGAQLEISGVIADDATGAHNINKVGPGKLIFSGPNTYAGLTDVIAGVLNVRNESALGSAAAKTTVRAGAALELQADLALETVEVFGNGVNINGHNTGAMRNVSNNNTFTGNLVLMENSTVGVDSGSQLTIGTKSGLVGSGIITEDLTGPPVGAPRQLAKELTGTLVLNNANTYTGLTDIIQGAIRVENATALGPTTSAGTQVRNGAQLQVNKDVNGANITIAAEHLDLSGTGIFGTGAVLAYGGANTWQGTVSLRSMQGVAAPPPATPPDHIAFGANNNASLAFDATIDQVAGPAPAPPLPYGVDKVGLGRIIFRANNTYGGVTTIYQGALNIQNANALGTIANGTIVQTGAALELQGLVSPGGINPFANEPLTLNGTGIANTGALRNVQGDNRWQGPITLQSTSAIGADAGTNLTVSSTISDPNATGPAGGALHKVGQGKVIFTTSHTYRGQTLIDEGVLDILNPQALGVANEVQTVTVAGIAGTFTITFNGDTTNSMPFNETAANVQTQLNILPSILNAGGSVTVSLAGGVYTITFIGGTLAGVDQPQVTALGVLGATATVATVTDGAAGTTVANGATLQLDTLSGPVTAERLTINGLGFGGTGALQNNVGVNTWARQIMLGSDASVGAANGNAAYPPSGFPAVADELFINAPIVDAGAAVSFGVTKVGPGVVSFFGADDNTYDGLTTVSQGVLVLQKNPGVVPFSGALKIGNDAPTGVDFSAVASVFTSESIPDSFNNNFASAVTVNPDGLLDLYTVLATETIDDLTVNGGHVEVGGGFLSARVLTDNDGDVDVASGTLFVNTTLDIQNGRVTLTGSGKAFVTGLQMAGGTIDLAAVGTQLILRSNVVATSSALPQTARITGIGTVDLNAANRTFTVNDNPAAPNTVDLRIDPAIIGAGSRLFKAGDGVMAIESDANTYSGGTQIDAGILQVDGTIANVMLNGGTLDGSDAVGAGTVGVVTADPNRGGVVAPGDSPGTLHSTGGVTWNPNVTFFVELNDPSNPGVTYDVFAVAGAIDLGLAHLDGDLGSAVAVNDSFTIITADTVVGEFAQGLFAFIDGKKFDVVYNRVPFGPDSVVITRIKNSATVSTVSSVNPSVFGQDVTVTATVTPEANASLIPGSSVTFTLTGPTIPVGTPILFSRVLVGGQASYNPFAASNFVLDVAPFGSEYHLTVTFPASPDFLQAQDLFLQQVNKANTQIQVSSSFNPAQLGDPVTLTADVDILAPGAGISGTGLDEVITGTVTFFIDGAPQPAVSVNAAGVASISPASLSVGQHLIRAAYSGDTHFNSANTTGDLTQQINKADTTTTVSSSLNPSDPNQNVIFTVSVTSGAGIPTGTVVIFDGAATFGSQLLVNGGATFAIDTLPPGSHAINVNYIGSTDFNGSSAGMIQVVRGFTSIAVSGAPNPSTANQQVTFTVTVTPTAPTTPTPTGNVEFYDGAIIPSNLVGASALASGTTTFDISSLSFGVHTINVKYVGDGNYLPNTNSTSQNVKGDTTVNVTANPSGSSTIGQLVTFTATVTPTAPASGIPAGDVRFLDGATLLGIRTLASGSASFDVSSLAIGMHTLNVQYLGNGSYNAGNGLVAHAVKGNTTTGVVSSLNPSTFGQVITFTATVSPVSPATQTPTGTVNFLDGAALIAANVGLDVNGIATFATGSLTAGTHVITASYNGAPLSNVSSATVTPNQVVNIAHTSTALASVSANPTFFGQAINFTATVVTMAPGVGTPVGSVDFFDGVLLIGDDIALDASGVAAFAYTNLTVGTHPNITAHFNGTNDFDVSTSNSISRTVNKASTGTALTSVPDLSSVYGQTAFTATVTPTAPGGGTPAGNVTFTITQLPAGTPQSITANLVGGAVTIMPALSPGNYTVRARYNGNGSYFFSDSNIINSHTVSKASTNTGVATTNANAVFGAATITAAVTVQAPGAGIPTGQVIFHVLGGPSAGNYPANVNTSGIATLPVNLSVGAYTISADYQGDANFNISNGALAGNQIITPVNTTVAVSSNANPSVFGQAVTFSGTITRQVAGNGAADGTANLVIDGATVQSNVLVNNGLATFFPISNLSVAGSPHTVRVDYIGSLNFNGNTNTLAGGQTVNKDDANVSLTANPTANLGDPVAFNASVTAAAPGSGSPSGTADLLIDGAPVAGNQDLPIVGGLVTFNVNSAAILNQGDHSVVVHYDGDGNFLAGNSNITIQSVRGAVSVGVASDLNPSIYGDLVTLTATVGGVPATVGTPGGTVDFIIDGVNLANNVALSGGQATFQIASINVAGSPHSVSVHYDGDTFFFTGDSGLAGGQTVNKANSVVNVAANPSTSVFGQPVTITATVSRQTAGFGTPDNTVDFFVDGINVGNNVLLNAAGQASIQIASIAVTGSPHTVTVHYDGSSNFNASDGALAGGQTVNQTATTSTVASALNPSVFQQNVTFTAQVTAQAPSVATPNGTVDFIIDAGAMVVNNVALDAAGLATFSTTALAIGSHTVQVHYDGNSNFMAGVGNLNPNQIVNPNPVAFAVIPGSVKSGTPFTIVVHYRNAAGTGPDPSFIGPVTLALASGPAGGAFIGQTSVNASGGVATFSGVILKAGAYTFAASANGLPVVVSAVLNVTASSLAVAISPAKLFSGKNFTISVTALDATGGVASNYNGAFTITVVKKPSRAKITGPATALFAGGFGQITRQVSVGGIYTFRINGPNGLTATFQLSIRARRKS